MRPEGPRYLANREGCRARPFRPPFFVLSVPRPVAWAEEARPFRPKEAARTSSEGRNGSSGGSKVAGKCGEALVCEPCCFGLHLLLLLRFDELASVLVRWRPHLHLECAVDSREYRRPVGVFRLRESISNVVRHVGEQDTPNRRLFKGGGK